MRRSASALPACAAAPPVFVAGKHADQIALAAEPDAVIQMRRYGCSAEPCPVYAVSIFPDGTAIYDGRANVGVIGRRQVRLATGELNALITALDAMDFLDSADDCCTCPKAAEQKLVTVDYRPGTVVKTVQHDQHCPRAPSALWALEREIDRSTGAGRLAALPVRSNIALGSSGSAPKQ